MRIYNVIREVHWGDLQDFLNRRDVLGLRQGVPSVGLHAQELAKAQQWCLMLARYPDDQVRGNAVLALGHLARRFGQLGDSCRPVVEAALADESGYVRGQAEAAADDIAHFLGWKIKGHSW